MFEKIKALIEGSDSACCGENSAAARIVQQLTQPSERVVKQMQSVKPYDPDFERAKAQTMSDIVNMGGFRSTRRAMRFGCVI